MRTKDATSGAAFHSRVSSRRYRRALSWRKRSKPRSESVAGRRCRLLEPPGCHLRWWAAPQRLRRQQMCRRETLTRVPYSLSAKRKCLTSAWRHSMCSTRKMPGHLRLACNLRGVAEAAEVAAAEPAEDAEAVEAAAVAVVRHGELAAGARLSRSPVTLTGAHRYGWVQEGATQPTACCLGA